MLKFKHYPKGSSSSTGNYGFRHYGDEETTNISRFAQFLNGTLEEITEDDWGGADTINAGWTYMLGLTGLDTLKHIRIADSVTKQVLFNNYGIFAYTVADYIRISPNLINFTLGSIFFSGSSDNLIDIVDFSDNTSIPNISSDTNQFFAVSTLKVPADLLSSWVSAWNGNISSKVTVEGV